MEKIISEIIKCKDDAEILALLYKFHNENISKFSFTIDEKFYISFVNQIDNILWELRMHTLNIYLPWSDKELETIMKGDPTQFSSLKLKLTLAKAFFESPPKKETTNAIISDDKDEYLNDTQIADMLRYKISTVRSKRSRGELPPKGKNGLTSKKAILEFIKKPTSSSKDNDILNKYR